MSPKVGKSYYITYLAVCIVISTPFIIKVSDLLLSNPVPAGGDPADHSLFVLTTLKSGIPLIEYSQFPSIMTDENISKAYYPSLLHTLVAAPTYLLQQLGLSAFAAVISSLTVTVFVSYLVGIVGYAFVVLLLFRALVSRFKESENTKYILVISLCLSLLAFGILIYSTSPILKTLRDGGYGEIFAMWTIFPYYVYMLLTKRWIISGILFGIIISTHNISMILTVMFTLSYLVSLAVYRDFKSLRRIWIFILTAGVSSVPALIYFYYPVVVALTGQETGLSSAIAEWSRQDIAEQIGPFLYVYGIISLCGVLFINYKASSWLVGWIVLIFVPFSLNLFFLERFAREFSIPFGMVTGVFSASIVFIFMTKYYPKILQMVSKRFAAVHSTRWQMITCIVLVTIILPAYYFVYSDRIESFGNSAELYYYSDAMIEANSYMLQLNNTGQGAILMFGVNPWLKPYIYDRYPVLEVETGEIEDSLSVGDRAINQELRQLIEDPQSDRIPEMLKKYNIEYIFLSDVLPDRWYPESQYTLVSKFSRFEELRDSDLIQLERQWRGNEGELLQVYSVSGLAMLD